VYFDALRLKIRAKFRLKVFNELKNRGQDDVLIAVVDDLRGFPD
jgi:transposase-like protein